MMPRKCWFVLVLALTVAPLALSGCAATFASTPPQPTHTVMYDVPTPPANPASESPTLVVETAALPPATAAPTGVLPSEAQGPEPRARLTIMHTNDSRGYLDPCG